MSRRQTGAILAIVLSTTIIGLIALATSPIWATALLLTPDIGKKPQEYVMTRMTREVTRMMVKGFG